MSDPFAAFMALADAAEGATLDLDPRDRGNWTGGRPYRGELRGSLRGISAAAYPTLDIARLTDDQVAAIRRADYWRPLCADRLPPAVAIVLADGGYNQGIGAAARDLQAALDVAQDGAIGPVTIAAAARLAPADLLGELLVRRALRYARTDGLATYGLGWMRRLAAAARAAIPYL